MFAKFNKIFNEHITYRRLSIASFILVMLFSLNPTLRLLSYVSEIFYFNDYIHDYNRYVLFLGTGIILIYLIKLKADNKLVKVKEFFNNNWPVALFFIFALLIILATLLNGVPANSVWGYYYRGEGLMGHLSYVVYFILSAFLVTPKQKEITLKSFAISSTFVGIVMFIDYIFLNEKYQFATGDFFFSNSNHTGYYLLMSIINSGMLFITGKKLIHKILAIVSFSLMSITLIMNDTWGCQVALIVGIIFTIIVYSIGKGKFQPKILCLVAALVITYLTAYATNDSLRDNINKNIVQQLYDSNALLNPDDITEQTTGVLRIKLWQNTLNMISEKPFIGHGADVTGDRLLAATNDNDRCHCEFLNYAVSYGIPATLFYIVAIFMIYLRGLLKKKHLTETNLSGLCTAFTYLASSLIGNSMYYTAPFLFIALGFGYVNDTQKSL